jgi:hypothetical protein
MTGMTSTSEGEGHRGRIDVSATEFRDLYDAVSNWGRWGDQGERGALNHLTADRVAAAARLVRNGLAVTLSQPFNTEASIENPEPGVHRMTMLTDEDIGSGTVRFAKDYIGVDYHNDGHSHIDALCHVAFDGCFFDGEPDSSVTERGAEAETIAILRNGLVGRGVLLDVPRLRGVPWMEPGEHVFTEDLEAAEREQGVRVGTGDILLVRTGHARRLAERARVGREQRHGPEQHGGDRFPDPRPRDQRDGGPPARLPAVRGPRPVLRGGRAVGVPVRMRPPATHSRHGIARQPDRDPLTDVKGFFRS